jgi:hypothetical protein
MNKPVTSAISIIWLPSLMVSGIIWALRTLVKSGSMLTAINWRPWHTPPEARTIIVYQLYGQYSRIY